MVTRRTFIKTAGAAAAALAVEGMEHPVKAFTARTSANPAVGAGGKVNVALIGIGFRGVEDEECVARTGLANVVALCDVDMGAEHTLKVMNKYPKAKKYKDFRKMFDEMGKEIEAVFVAVPDFAHFPIAMRAIKEGIHVYCEKPLTRTFFENELLLQAAKMHPNVVTQMGNQGHSEGNYFQFKAWKEAGIIKDVTEITAHMNNDRRWHKWDPNISRYPVAEPIPSTLDWDLWHMSQIYHDYSDKYHRGNWRCWYDFGMGALGDWGAHLIDTAHEFLDLGLPYEVDLLRADGWNNFFFPMSSTIKFRFPRRGDMPSCDITWYDGLDNIPEVPVGYGSSVISSDVPTVNGGMLKPAKLNPGKIIYSKDLIFKGGSHGSTLSIIPEEAAKDMANKLPEVPKSPSDHYTNFLNACMGKEQARSRFEVAVPLCQVFNLGVIAQRIGHGFKFDRNTKEVIGDPFASALLAGNPPRKGWEDYYKL